MRLWYNQIELQSIQVLHCEHKPVWDGGVVFLYHEHTLTVRGLLNPSHTAYDLPARQTLPITVGTPSIQADGSPGTQLFTGQALRPGLGYGTTPRYQGLAPPYFDGGTPGSPRVPTMPVWTEQAIRHQLSQPRKQLLFTAADSVILMSPAYMPENVFQSPGASPAIYPSDAKNGPIPTVLNIRYVGALRTWEIEFSVKTWLTSCDLYKPPDAISALLSHRWQASERLDQDMFRTRTIRGQAIFRTDRLAVMHLTPDDYRAFLFVPADVNYKRGPVHVWPSPDGSSLSYEIVDREISMAIIARLSQGQVTRIEATYEAGMGAIGIETMAMKTAGHAVDIARHTVAGALSMDVLGTIRAVGGDIMADLKDVASMVPRTVFALAIRVWGSPDCTRADLTTVAIRVLLDRISPLQLAVCDARARCKHDLMGKFVELVATFNTGPIATGLVLGGVNPFGVALFNMLGGMDPAPIPSGVDGVPPIRDKDEITFITKRPENIDPRQISTLPSNMLPKDFIPGPYPYAGQSVAFPPQGVRGPDYRTVQAAPLQEACSQPQQPTDDTLPTDGRPDLPYDGNQAAVFNYVGINPPTGS